MSATEIQSLLRFLSQDAKIPLALAMGKVKALQQAELATIDAIAKVKIAEVQEIFEDEKLSKQVLNVAKRISKKRAAGDDTPSSPRKKRYDGSMFSLQKEQTPAELEASLELPSSDASLEDLADVVVFTNRAPLVLAFIVVHLKHTMPEQPLSSRLSLAQTYVSVTSRARAVNLGIENGQSAEELGMGIGQATVTIMGKELRVLKRWGYDWKDEQVQTKSELPTEEQGGGEDGDAQIKPESAREEVKPNVEEGELEQHLEQTTEEQPPLWGLDLEALKKTSTIETATPTLARAQTATTTNMPIHTPQAARAYLLKSFDTPPPAQPPSKKVSAATKAAEKERNLSMLLRALDLLYQSWIETIGPRELDRRVWGWYIRVRPAVEQGVAGWGGKNEVKLADILALRREA